MRWVRKAAVLLCLIAAGAEVSAGAWVPEPGKGFLSFGGVLRSTAWGTEVETSVYSEYGLAPRLAIGVDLNEQLGAAGHALMFLRVPLLPPEGRTRMSFEAAAGVHYTTNDLQPMTRVGVSIGRGIRSRWGDGWINADFAWERRYGLPEPAIKADLTLGLSSGPRLRPIFQVFTTTIPGREVYWTVTPGLLVDWFGGTWHVGLERKSPPQDSIGLKLALWRRF